MADESTAAGVSPDKQLDLLHDHYKDTFTLMRDREKQRDRTFLVVIVLYALLTFEIQYPASFRSSLGTINIGGNQLQLQRLPLAGLLDASWVLVLAVALTYCRTAINVERQYSYLHRLEEWLSSALNTPTLYRREGSAYLEGYPVFLDWTWVCYVLIFPLVVLLATLALLVVEWRDLSYAPLHKAFDSSIALVVAMSFLLYRVIPMILERARAQRRAGTMNPRT
jgi:hypothetical protein